MIFKEHWAEQLWTLVGRLGGLPCGINSSPERLASQHPERIYHPRESYPSISLNIKG